MPADLPEIDNILHSGALAYGKWGREFERALKEYIGCEEEVITTNSYSSALQVMLSVVGIKPDDEIIASPQACLASTQPLATSGARVIWADIDPTRGTLDPSDVSRKITSKTKMIVHNHHCSYPGYIDEINEIGMRHGIVVVDDCIEAFGSEYKGKLMGNVGTAITTFSFQTVRLPNAIEEGGIIFKDRTLYEKALRTRDLGIDRTQFRNNLGEINQKFDISESGYGATPNEINSYIGYSQMKDINGLIEKQRNNAIAWKDKLSKSIDIKFLNTTDINPSYWIFGTLVSDKESAIKAFRDNGWYASGVHLPNTYYSRFGNQGNFKGVSDFYSKFIALPSGWWVNQDKI